jgi:putative transposase
MHPRAGARTIYMYMSKDECCKTWFDAVGRDKVESILLNNGYRIRHCVAFHRTTRRGLYTFPNKIIGLTLSDINQVWVSDITYYIVVVNGRTKHFYLTFIMDLFSRRILGFAISDRLTTEDTTFRALQIALNTRKARRKNQLEGLILHSDGGGQFIEKKFLATLGFFGIISSMGKQAYENPNAERLNGTIKNDYLIPWDVISFSQLKISTPKAVKLYNEDRIHSALNKLTPCEFENSLNQ